MKNIYPQKFIHLGLTASVKISFVVLMSTSNIKVNNCIMLPHGGGRCAHGVHFFSESLIFSPTAHFLQDFPFDILTVFPIQMHRLPLLTLSKNRSRPSQGHDLFAHCSTWVIDASCQVSLKLVNLFQRSFYHIWAWWPSWSCDLFLAHLSRRLTGELVVCPCSVVVHPSSTISKIFSETAWPIKAKLHVEHP